MDPKEFPYLQDLDPEELQLLIRQARRRTLLRRLLIGSLVVLFIAVAAASIVTILTGITRHDLLDRADPRFDTDTYLNRGRKALETRRPDLAVVELTRVLRQVPDHAEARLLLGRAYLDMNKSSAAARELERLRQLGLPYSTYAVWLAEALLQQGEYARLLAELLATDLPDRAKAQLLALRSQAYLYRDDPAAARRELAAAQALAPRELPVRLAQVRLALAQNHTAEAETVLARLLADEPGYAPAWSLKGDLALRQGDFLAADTLYTVALKYRYADAADLINRALARIQLGNDQGARADIRAARERLIEHSGILFAEALLQLRQHNPTEAWNRLAAALERDPEYLPLKFYLGLLHYSLGQWKQGTTQLADYYRQVPSSSQTALLLAGGAILGEEWSPAANTLQAVLKQYPEEPTTLELLGYVASVQGKVRESIELLQEVARQQPQAAAVHARLGLLLLVTGETAQGLHWLDRAAALAPDQETLQALRVFGRLRAGQTAAALELLKELRSRRRDSPVFGLLSGLAYRSQGEAGKAKAAFEGVLERMPEHFLAALQLIELGLAEHQIGRVREQLQTAFKTQPGHPVLPLLLAELDARAGSGEAARRHLEEVLAQQPNALGARLRLAELWLADEQPKQAIAVLQQAPEPVLRHPAVQVLLGQAQLAAGHHPDAVQTLRSLVLQQPAARHYFLLATAYAGQGDAQAAQRELDKSLALDPTYRPAQFARARQRLAAGHLAEAGQLLETLRQPEDGNVLDLTGELAMTGHDFPGAIAAFGKARQRYPGVRRFALKLAKAHQEAGQPEAAAAVYHQWLADHTQDGETWLALANLYLRLGREAEAEQAFARLLEVQPGHPAALNSLGWLLRRRAPQQARRYVEQALQQMPDNPEYKGTLALILLAQGNKAQARALLENVLSGWSTSPSARFYLVQALVQAGASQTARWALRQLLADNQPFPERPQARALLEQLSKN